MASRWTSSLLVLLALLAYRESDRKCCAAEIKAPASQAVTSGRAIKAPYEIDRISYAPAKPSNFHKHNFARLVSNTIGNDYLLENPIERSRFTRQTPLQIIDLNRPGGPVGAELAKLLHLKQGYYSDLYDEMVKPPNSTLHITTKPPVDAFEEAIESAVVSALRRA